MQKFANIYFITADTTCFENAANFFLMKLYWYWLIGRRWAQSAVIISCWHFCQFHICLHAKTIFSVEWLAEGEAQYDWLCLHMHGAAYYISLFCNSHCFSQILPFYVLFENNLELRAFVVLFVEVNYCPWRWIKRFGFGQTIKVNCDYTAERKFNQDFYSL